MRIPSLARRDCVAFAVLLAIGLAMAATASAAFSGVARTAVADLFVFIGQRDVVNTAVTAEQHRQAAAIARMERSLDLLRGELARLAIEAEAAADARQDAPPTDAAAANRDAGGVDVAPLRSSFDEYDERIRASFAGIHKRIDWLETLVYARDATGAAVPPLPTATPGAAANTATTIRNRWHGMRSDTHPAAGWLVLHAENGVAVIAGKSGTIDVTPGYVIPELGRVDAIRQQDGRWQVVTEMGTITQR